MTALIQTHPAYPLPDNLPADRVCWQIEVPNDDYYIQQLTGAIYLMSVWTSYDRDTTRRGREVAALWRAALATLKKCEPCPPCPPASGGGDDDCMTVKQDPDNPCLLREVCPDGSLGCVVFDASKCMATGQPGGGGTQPGPGECQDYNVKLSANGQLLLPFSLSPGDTIEILTAKGAGGDGTLHWFCPDGTPFVAGICLGLHHTETSDPVPTAPHMSIVISIGGTFYALPIGAPLTVPSGPVGAAAILQVNDSNLADNSGDYSLLIRYCNNQTPPTTDWCTIFDFTVSDGGFTLAPGYAGVYTPGVGWVASSGFLGLLKVIPIATIVNQVVTAHTALAAYLVEIGTDYANPPGALFTKVYTGTDFFPPPENDLSVLAGFQLFLGGPGTSDTLTSVKMAGHGPNPFGANNC